ncbi:hypothetical protein LUZ62_054311 [Rhynchospora pubera]|uniref:RING-type E3 ubiquitin transferase n=1 Tax=Rhynchospora pubera TaxID=906938 RepID=A0AAV8DQ64_9POAL|nr:hypothetical protein LUZ62_054311 [Rhynchospora pubera]
MGDNWTGAQKFWCSACIVWLIFIFVAYRDHFHGSAWSAIVILFVGGFPMITFLISLARSKYRVSHDRHQRRDVDPLPIVAPNMIAARMISPEAREPPRTNLAYNSFIDAPVTYVYQKDGKAEENECVVCLGQFQQGEMVARLQFCSHLFHENCINPWLRQHKTCPICRSRVDQKAAEESMVRHIAAAV